jgi:hypothetical protein
MITVQFDPKELDKLTKKIEKMAAFDRNNRKAIMDEARKAAKIYVSAARGNIRDYGSTITVRRKSGTTITIPSGTLRRSMGTWTPRGALAHVAAGPRASSFGKKLPHDRDGWFAHFVEYGNFAAAFGGKKRTANTGVFQNTQKQVGSQIAKQMQEAMLKLIQR